MAEVEDRDWQRLDKWLWCARFLRHRAECAQLAAAGQVRINRQPTDKAHARLRPGHVLTLALRGEVRVVRVLRLGERRGPAAEARQLYEDVAPPDVAGQAAPGGGTADPAPPSGERNRPPRGGDPPCAER